MTWDASVSERFSREVPLERARLALEDPDGESDALEPLTQAQAHRILIAAGEPAFSDRSVPLSGISTDPPPPLLVDRLDPLGHTILYGTGGVGKGALACWWIVLLRRSGLRVLVLDYEKHPEEWSRRIASLDHGIHEADGIRHLAPVEPIRKASAEIAMTCDMHGLDYVVVDSAVMAAGADPLKPEAAAEYAAAILDIGRPVLTLAHVTKEDDARYPFGSIFWHNLARTTWGMQADRSGTTVLSHRKHNNYARIGPFAVTSTWHENQLSEVWERNHSVHLKDRIAEVLANGPMTVAEIVESLNGDEDEGSVVRRETVQRVLRRYLLERFRLSGTKYELAS